MSTVGTQSNKIQCIHKCNTMASPKWSYRNINIIEQPARYGLENITQVS